MFKKSPFQLGNHYIPIFLSIKKMTKKEELTQKLQKLKSDLKEIKSLKIFFGGVGLTKVVYTSKKDRFNHNTVINLTQDIGLSLFDIAQLEKEGVKCYWEKRNGNSKEGYYCIDKG